MKLLYFLTLPLFILDQLTKLWILRNFRPTNETGDHLVVVPGFFDLVRVHNTGVAFGQFQGAYSNVIFGVISLGALVLILFLWWRTNFFPTRMMRLCAALLCAGILGNVTDRFLHGYVVDFLSFDLKFMLWPSFNVADACISVAAGLLFLSIFLEGKKDSV